MVNSAARPASTILILDDHLGGGLGPFSCTVELLLVVFGIVHVCIHHVTIVTAAVVTSLSLVQTVFFHLFII